MASSSTTKVSLKLLIDTKNKKVLFAEASKSVIDFLFSLLFLPIGTVIKLLGTNGMVGSLGNLYQSVESLNQIYMLSDQSKDVLLNPNAQCSFTELSGFLTHNVDEDNTEEGTKLYMCQHRCNFQVSYDPSVRNSCGHQMNHEVSFIGNKTVDEKKAFSNIKTAGFVKDVITFMVMDDLVIQPMSTISTITLLNKFNVKELGTLQEKIVEMGMDEGIKLLKASLKSKRVLTTVFLQK